MGNQNKIEEAFEHEIENRVNDTLINNAKIKSKHQIIISLIIVFFIMILGVLLYVVNNPKLIFQYSISSIFKIVENNINSNYDYISGNSKIDLNFTNSNYYYNLENDYSYDNKNNYFNFDIKANRNNQFIGEFNLYNDNSGIYLYSSLLNDINASVKIYDSGNLVTREESLIIVKALNDAVLSSINGEKFNVEKTTLNISDEKVKVKCSYLVIDKNNIQNITKKFIDSLKANSEFMKIYNQNSQSDIENLKYKYNTNIKPIKISLYTKGLNNQFVGFEVTNEDNIFQIINVKNNKQQYKIIVEDNMAQGHIETYKKQNKTILVSNFKTDNYSGSLKIVDKMEKADQFKKIVINNYIKLEQLNEDQIVDVYKRIIK